MLQFIKEKLIFTLRILHCPNCGEIWDGIECDECGFDATEADIY